MNITKAKLQQIILEEIKRVEQEDLILEGLSELIDLQAKQMGVVLTEQEKEAYLQKALKKLRKYGFGVGVGAALAGASAGLHSAQSGYAQDLRDRTAQNVAAAEARAQDPVYQASQIKKQLNNEAAFMWTTSTNPDDRTIFPGVERLVPISPASTGQTEWAPANFQAVKVNPGEIIRKGKNVIAILPPEWSVLKKVLEDVEAGNGPTIEQNQTVDATGAAHTNRVEFFNSDVWNNASLDDYGASSPYRGALYVTFDSLPDNYAMPLSGKSPSEYYAQMWDDYVGY
tara:strand:- start:357 stop:1211 length:855 start_codon:yes stop_codon:yes gene_type:complete